jgi:hypothetical protein
MPTMTHCIRGQHYENRAEEFARNASKQDLEYVETMYF